MATLIWTFPLLMFAAIVIGWAAEILSVRLSAGIALAVLAWLQTSPEFAVEATIAWHRDAHLALANLTGSLRLLLGFGWPVVFFIYWATHRKQLARVPSLTLPANFRVESIGLAFPVLYFLVIYFKGTWTPWDGLILCSFYGLYFLLLVRQKKDVHNPEEDTEDDPWVVRRVLEWSKKRQWLAILGMFAFGAVALIVTVHPFIESLKSVAFALGVSEFVFIQWIAPIASEFPEKVTAFGWARKKSKVPYAIVNMLSSVTSQWTLLAGLVPIVFSISAGEPFTIVFSEFQREEILLTVAQSALTVVILADLKIAAWEMVGFFGLWLAQFVAPSLRGDLIPVYFAWTAGEAVRLLSYRFLRLKM